MFFQYRSNSLLQLSKIFSTHISEEKSEHPFQKKWVVIQNKQAQQWLTLQVATHSGIAANIEFILPSELIWKIYRSFFPETPKILPGDRIPLQWIIFDFLTDTDSSVFSKVKGFPKIKNEMQAYRLSVQLADVFDLYQVYRPEMTEAWKKGSLSTKSSREYWQLWIWREIQSRIIEIGAVPDRGFVFRHLIETIEETEFNSVNLPSEIFCFGLSQFSNPFAELISNLSRKIDINYYNTGFRTNSNDFFNAGWNSLAEDWGKPKSNSEQLIMNILKSDEIEVIESEPVGERSIYSKIEKNEDAGTHIDIHSCHSPGREVETLKDYLFTCFESDRLLKPQDILIMVPDMKEYAPLIQSGFSDSKGEFVIPVYASGSYSRPDLIAFSKFLELVNGSVKVNEFIDFIELEAIRDNFALNEEELSVIKSWIQRNNIFWGLDETDSSFSLKKLSKALISGYITEPDAYDFFEEFIPFDSILTTDQFELAAKLASLVNLLSDLREELNTVKSPESWIDFFTYAALNLINPNNSSLIPTLDSLREACLLSGVSKKIAFPIIYQWIFSQLGDIQATSSGFGHGVVVSSYIPYRGIPFKHVAILGMNESVFPRNPDRPAFDLMHIDPKPGDRITKEDDALLFLEVLTSVSDRLYISYIGQDLYTDNEKLPSTLLQKLMDVAAEFRKELIIKKEKLHGFNPDYFVKRESFSDQRQKLAQLINTNSNKKKPVFFNLEKVVRKEIPNKIHLSELIDFFVHPNKYIIQQQLSISAGYADNELSDRELFGLDGLSRWVLNNQLLDAYEQDIGEAKVFDFLDKSGSLPKGIPGSNVFISQSIEVKEFLEEITEFSSSGTEIIQCSIEIDGVELYGNIAGITNGKRVIWRMGKSRPKDLVTLWVEHLMLATQNIEYLQTLFITNEQGKIQLLNFEIPEKPFEILSELLNWFMNFYPKENSLPFFVNSSFAYAQKIIEGKGEEEAIKSAQKEWLSTERSNGEDSDYYINLIWKGELPIQSEAFKKLALRFWVPLMNNLREGK